MGRSLKTLGISIAVVLIAVAMVVGSQQILKRINILATANSDNVQWTLSQVEVEYLELLLAISQAREDPASDLSSVRRHFDILYSRIRTLDASAIYSELRSRTGFSVPFARVDAFLTTNSTLIDRDDAELRPTLPRLQSNTEALRSDIRELALEGIGIFAEQSDRRREGVETTLLLAAGLAFGLVWVLLAAFALLLRLYRQLQRRASDVQITTSRLRAVAVTSLDAIVVINRDGIVLDFNGAAESIFEYSRIEALGQRLSDLIVPDAMKEAHEAGLKRYRETGEHRVAGKGRLQLEARRKSGEIFPVELSINTAESEDGEIFVSFLRDISERKAAERALLQARDEALAGEKAKAQLLAVMSHEMRTPLNGLLGTMELMKDTGLDERQREYIDIMETSGEHLLHHVNDVLDISRLDSGKIEIAHKPFVLSELVTDVVESQNGVALAGGNRLTLSRMPERDRVVLGDPNRLRQILLNLVGNALKFTDEGTITIDIDCIPGTDFVEFRITDTGIGIPEDKIEKIFDEFVTLDASYSRETGGTGLGLAITRRLVHALGGEIGVESEVGEGSMFWFRLPLRAAAQAIVGTAATPRRREVGEAVSTERSLSVLVVEDNKINRRVASEMLEGMGHSVTLAADGAEGVALAAKARFDLILMDISMPRMDGIEATKSIRSDGASRESRIVAMTAHALPNELKDFKDAGMEDTLIKPISKVALRRVIDALGSTYEPQISEHADIVDRDQITRLAETVGADHLKLLFGTLVDEAETALEHLPSESHSPEDLRAFQKKVHKLAGSAAIFGASKFHGELSDLEASLKEGRLSDLKRQHDNALTSWEKTRIELTRSIDSMVDGLSSLEAE